jgi:hypothetical protein
MSSAGRAVDLLAEKSASTPEVKNVGIVGIVGLGQEAGGATHVASARQVGRI